MNLGARDGTKNLFRRALTTIIRDRGDYENSFNPQKDGNEVLMY